jgi:hypothetical protein
MSGGTGKKSKTSKGKKTAWQTHGGALFDHMSKSALDSLKSKLGLNTEIKYADNTGTSTTTATCVARINFPAIAQGLTSSSREGASIRVTKVRLRMDMQSQNVAATQIRILVVRFTRSGAPVVADIVQSATNFSTILNHHFYENGYQLLMDKIVTVGGTGSDNASQHVIETFSNANWHAVWPDTDTTGLASALSEGNITVFWWADSISVAPIFNSIMRVEYVDN